MKVFVRQEPQELPEGFEDFLDPHSTAVISIDMHRSHLEDSPDCPCPAPTARSSIEPTDRFHRVARSYGIPIIHVRTFLRKDGVDDLTGNRATWRRVYPLIEEPPSTFDQHVMEGTRWPEFLTEVEPNDLIVHKKRMSSFFASDLDFLLRNLGRSTIVITGIFVDACDLSTAFAAADLDYRVVIPRDIAKGSSSEMEDAALSIVSMYLGLVVESEDLIAQWEARGSSKDAKAG